MGDPKKSDADKTGQEPKDGKDKNGKADVGGGKTKQDPKADKTVAGLVKDVWGYLPEKKRQEMDTYSKEQFMPQYEQLLRQYYETIAAQGKNKGGD
jgi:hypothetical protein